MSSSKPTDSLDPQKRPRKGATFAEYLAYLYLNNLPLVLEHVIEGQPAWRHLGHTDKEDLLRYCEGHEVQKGPKGLKNPSVPAGEWFRIDRRKALQGLGSEFFRDPGKNAGRGRPEQCHELSNRGWRLHLQTRATPEAAHWRDHLNNVEEYQENRHDDALTRLEHRDAVNEFRKMRRTDEDGNTLSGYRQDVLSAAQAGSLHGIIRMAPRAVQCRIVKDFAKTCKPESVKYVDFLHPFIVAVRSIGLRGIETALANPRLFKVDHINKKNAFDLASNMTATLVSGMAGMGMIPPEMQEPRAFGVGPVRVCFAYNSRGTTTIARANKIRERRKANQLKLAGF